MFEERFPHKRRRAMHEQNRRSWNAVTPAHNSHKRDQTAFFRDGGSTLFPEEIELLGDVTGRRIAHLQCNCGQDTLSLARLGAAEVTGVDISDAAIEYARSLSIDSGIDATFHRTDLFDWFANAANHHRFDVAFSTYGTIGWLCDLDMWAGGVSQILEPGGLLVLLEFHPLVWSFGAMGATGDPYFLAGPIEESGVNDYVGPALAPSGFQEGVSDFQNPEPNFGFQWTVAQIVQAVIDADLQLETLREYRHANGCELFDGMQRLPGNRYGMPEDLPSIPLMLGLTARRPA